MTLKLNWYLTETSIPRNKCGEDKNQTRGKMFEPDMEASLERARVTLENIV